MNTSFTITIYMDDKPHRLNVNVKTTANITKYKVVQDSSNKIHILPDSFIISHDGKRIESQNEEGTVEQQQLIRLIWQHISNIISV